MIVTAEKKEAFLTELVALCRKHQLSIGPANEHSELVVHPYDESYDETIRAADATHRFMFAAINGTATEGAE